LSPYASLIYKTKPGFVTELGGRWNHHSVYGDNFTYTLNPSWPVNKNLKAFVNLYSAFKTPTLYQLFDPSIGNPHLDAEKSIIIESGFALSVINSFRCRIVGFYRNTKNAIQYIVTDPATFAAQYRNASKEINYGMEIESAFSTGKWSFNFNYAYTDGKIKSMYNETGTALSKDTTYSNLYRVPKNALNFTAGVQVTKSVYISSLLKIAGKRLEPIYASLPIELAGYYTINLYGEYKISKTFKIFADLKNITDQQYFDFLGYNSNRFNFMTGIYMNL
jgi:vitamin B12 transporter